MTSQPELHRFLAWSLWGFGVHTPRRVLACPHHTHLWSPDEFAQPRLGFVLTNARAWQQVWSSAKAITPTPPLAEDRNAALRRLLTPDDSSSYRLAIFDSGSVVTHCSGPHDHHSLEPSVYEVGRAITELAVGALPATSENALKTIARAVAAGADPIAALLESAPAPPTHPISPCACFPPDWLEWVRMGGALPA